jgi:hypothetical protein
MSRGWNLVLSKATALSKAKDKHKTRQPPISMAKLDHTGPITPGTVMARFKMALDWDIAIPGSDCSCPLSVAHSIAVGTLAYTLCQ